MTRDDRIRAAFAHIGAARRQLLPSDDPIIAEHIVVAERELESALLMAPQPAVEILDRAEDVYTEYGYTSEDFDPEAV